MNTKLLCSFGFEDTEGFKNLLCCHSVFCIPGIVHNIIADLEHTTRIITAADGFWNFSHCTLYRLDMCDVVKIDDSTDLICIAEFLFRSIVGREHDIAFFTADCLGKHQFCHG